MAAASSTSESKRMAENFRLFYEQMALESDRGAVIVSVSLLEEILTGLLKSRLAPSLEKTDELFDSGFSLFFSFSAKIDLAYRIGLLRPTVRSSLHLLRKVRNNFAHATEIKGFDDLSTQDQIRELVKLNVHLLNTITEVVRDAVPKSGVEKTKDLVELMGWRGTLQLIFAALAAGMNEAASATEPLEALTDSASIGTKSRKP